MTRMKMKREEVKRLNQLTVEMGNLCREIRKEYGQGIFDNRKTRRAAFTLGWEFDMLAYAPVMRPEVSDEARKTDRRLFRLVRLLIRSEGSRSKNRPRSKARAATAGR